MPDAKDTKLVMFHCPEEVRAEMDALCEFNMIDRTEFLLQAIYKLMDFIETQQKKGELFSLPYPEFEEEVLMAADDSDDEQ